jgi:NAD+ synthetase
MFKSNLNVEKVHKVMVNHLADYVMNNKLRACVLGISGGIDSTVVAVIIRDVQRELKERGYHVFNFVGVSMPTKTTDPHEFWISELVGRSLCDEFKVIDIDSEVESIVIPQVRVSDDLNNRYRIGNVKSRVRMIHLYDLAKAYSGIVVGTDNKTELMLGYSTIGGDALFDYCPIQYLWKTEIYDLAHYYMEMFKEIEMWDVVHAINESINIPPQAGLGISATDMDEIHAPNYLAVDTVLYNDENNLPQPDEEYVKYILDRKKANAYKRNLPIVINRENFED